MSTVANSTKNQAPYALPDNFDLSTDKKAKSNAIWQKVGSIFSQNKGKIAAFAILTLPLFPLTWLFGTLGVYLSAKSDVITALAKKRLELIGKDGTPGKLISTIKTNGQDLPKNYKEATRILVTELSHTEFPKYFKPSHAQIIASSSAPNNNSRRSESTNWKTFKTDAKTVLTQVWEKKTEIMKNFHMTETELDSAIFEMMRKGQENNDDAHLRKDMMTTLSTARPLLDALTEFHDKQTLFLTLARNAQSKTNKAEATRSILEGMEDGLKNALNELNSQSEPLTISIKNLQLPIISVVSRDAKVQLSACKVGTTEYRQTPGYAHLLEENDQTFTMLKGDNREKRAYKELMANQVLAPQIRLYNEITTNTPKMSDENKNILWVILQASRTQAFLTSLNAVCSDFYRSFATNDTKQNIFINYDYDKKSDSLNIIFKRRFEFLGVMDAGGKAPMTHNLYAAVKMTIDLANPNLKRRYKILSLKPVPVSQETVFDRLPYGGRIPQLPVMATASQDIASSDESLPSESHYLLGDENV